MTKTRHIDVRLMSTFLHPGDDSRPPSWRLLLGELRVVLAWLFYKLWSRPHPLPDIGEGLPVITLPGFMASDLAMRQLRSSLRAAGFRAYGWGLGRNRGATADLIARIDARVDEVIAREGRAPALVGWSLGGLFAREYAKHYPHKVARVITMGTPFSGSRRANHAWRLYQLVAGHDVDAPPVPFHPAAKPPVPTVALWSPQDGIVAANCARGEAHERDAAVEVRCRHISFVFAPAAARALVQALV
jgi:pimeloyl-ACP methyl ester carboxylesterase